MSIVGNLSQKVRRFITDAPADGQQYARKDASWVRVQSSEPEGVINNIGIAGNAGFGVGVCPPHVLKESFKPLYRSAEVGHENYGNYIHESDGSIMCWVPSYWYREGHADSPNYAAYGNNSLDILPFNAFPNRATAALSGFALDRAAIDDGIIQPGFMFDKYLVSNNGGIASSVKYGNPLSSAAAHNPFSALNGSPANIYAGIIDALKTRGADFFPSLLAQISSLHRLSRAHAQASKSTYACAWYDATGVMNFPKGCNNNALRDVNDTSVLYQSSGYSQCGKTGSGIPFEKTTHNGQACGIADLSGPMWHICIGMVTHGGRYYVLSEDSRAASITSGNTLPTDAWGAAGVAQNYIDAGATWGDLRATSAQRVLGHPTNRVFAADTDGTGWHMSGAGVPLLGGTGGSNAFGNDGFWDYRPAEMCPLACGSWLGAGLSGPGARDFSDVRGTSNDSVGGRGALYLVARHDSDWMEPE